jgi:hypothetical protein
LYSGFAEAAVGLYSGIELKGKADLINTLPPLEKSSAPLPKQIGCNECHKAEFDGSFLARDPFLLWKHFLAKVPKEEPLGKLDLSMELLKLCFLDDPEVRSCIDRCCDKDTECTPSADGMSGTCGPCDASLGQCCGDSDCTTEEKCIAGACSKFCTPNIPSGYCCSNEDCTPQTPLCGGTDGHTCITCSLDTAECCRDSDCGDLTTFSCTDRYCMTRACDKNNERCCDDSDCREREGAICQSRTCVLPGNPRFTLRWYGEGKSAGNINVDKLDMFFLSSPHMPAFSHNSDDLDLHVQTPNRFHLYFSTGTDPVSGGFLDVDMIPSEPSRNVENIQFPTAGTSPAGTYYFWVDPYSQYGDADSWTVSVFLDRGGTPSATPTATYSGTGASALFRYVK